MGIPVEVTKLYYLDDPDFEIWLEELIDRVHQSKKRANEEAERKAKSK